MVMHIARTSVEPGALGEAVLRAAVVVAPHGAARYTQHNVKRGCAMLALHANF